MRASLHLDAAPGARNPDAVAQALKATETLEGILDQILFVNDKNGYSVAVVVVPQEHGDFRRVTVVGNLAGLEVGSTIRAVGGFQQHQRFGEQFHVVDYETLRPAGSLAIERYLASEIKGIGPVRAHRIAEYFGDALGEVLDNSPDRMREVPGVGSAAARLIAAAWRDASGLRELTV
ncbi:helix-hairpin-helix domain-containing protein, partial [Candidatus Binatus sp.]|uniref:helix-hairpin-helix domain-containing protein n=1 Tax=Candidatus Binatus sp. TaxID=2811406 RepID=UPI003CC6692A